MKELDGKMYPKLTVKKRRLPLKKPFVTAMRSVDYIESVFVSLGIDRLEGIGEARGLHYHGETSQTILADIESVRSAIEQGASRTILQDLLPAGGARNALDCASWFLQAAMEKTNLWTVCRVKPGPVTTAFTLSVAEPEAMAAEASALSGFPILKLKIDGQEGVLSVEAVRKARPEAVLIVDANQSLGGDARLLHQSIKYLQKLGVALLEQPVPVGQDDMLAGIISASDRPLLCADETIKTCKDFDLNHAFYDVINIKLDKTGGLTEALALKKRAIGHGKKIMIGNMVGTELAMLPAMILARDADFSDLDGPLLLRDAPARYLRYDGPYIWPLC